MEKRRQSRFGANYSPPPTTPKNTDDGTFNKKKDGSKPRARASLKKVGSFFFDIKQYFTVLNDRMQELRHTFAYQTAKR